MSYEPTNWKDGDLVTSAKLNKMEQGIASYNIIEAIMDNQNFIVTLNKTWQEIWNNNYTYIVIFRPSAKLFVQIQGVDIVNKTYRIVTVNVGTQVQTIFTCDSPNKYPSYQEHAG